MLDITYIRQHSDEIKKGLTARNVPPHQVDEILLLDAERRKSIGAVEAIKQEKNNFNRTIIKLSGKEKTEKIKEMTELTKREGKLDEEIKNLEATFVKLLSDLPNIPAEDVIVGKDESENKVLKKIGQLPQFAFKAKSYLELAEALDIIDTKRAGKVSGPRFGFLKKEGAVLWNALIQYTLSILLKERFIPFYSPTLIKEEVMSNTGYNSYTEGQEAYFIEKDRLFLVGTGEHALLPYHSDEILDKADLPLSYTTYSTCYRREAGSYGKDTSGILRVHQFDKQEMVVLTTPENSWDQFSRLLKIQEEIINGLELPYQLLMVCTGDLPRPSAKVIDLECWMPAEGKYRETHSASNCTDYQARRNNIRYRTADHTTNTVHILNATAMTARTLLSIIENNQEADGSINIPKVLQPYCNGKKTIQKKA